MSNAEPRHPTSNFHVPAIRVRGLPTATPIGSPGAGTLAPTSSATSPHIGSASTSFATATTATATSRNPFITSTPQHQRHGPAAARAPAAACGVYLQTPSPKTIDLPPSVHAAFGNLTPTDPSLPAPPSSSARHCNSRGSAGGTGAGGSSAATPSGQYTPLTNRLKVRVASRPRDVFTVDLSRVWHVPATTSTGGAVATLCPHFDVRTPSAGACSQGSTCAYVHADIRGATRYTPHTVDAARSGLFHCYAAGARVTVLPPPVPFAPSPSADQVLSAEASFSLSADLLATALAAEADVPPAPFVARSECLLRTRALPCDANGNVAAAGGDSDAATADTAVLGPVTMCCHFTTKHSCDRGVRCKYAHVLPAAYAHHLRPHPRAAIDANTNMISGLGVVSDSVLSDVDSARGDNNGTCAATLGETMGVDADGGHAAPSPSSPTSRLSGGVFRHDPYSAAPRRVS